MGDRHYPLDITVPASTPPGSPISSSIVLEDLLLADVEIIIPAGHVALTGVRVMQSSQQIIPWGNLSWITSDNYSRIFAYNERIGAHAISVQCYNTDIIAHTFYLRFHISDLVNIGAGTPSQIAGGIGTVIGTGTGAGGLPVGGPGAQPPPPLPPPPPIGVPPLPGLPGGGTAGGGGNQRAYMLVL